MQAITVTDRTAGIDGFTLMNMPYPPAAENDVIVQGHAAGFTPGELDWPATWSDRAGRAGQANQAVQAAWVDRKSHAVQKRQRHLESL